MAVRAGMVVRVLLVWLELSQVHPVPLVAMVAQVALVVQVV